MGVRHGHLLGRQCGPQQIDVPDVEGPFLAIGVRIQRREVAPFASLHLAHHPARSAFDHVGVQRPRVEQPGIGVQRQQRAIVVEHLLEMRDLPALVGAVAEEATAELVEDAATGHVVQGLEHRVARELVLVRDPAPEQEVEIGDVRELRRPAEATPALVVRFEQLLAQRLRDPGGRLLGLVGRVVAHERLAQLAVLAFQRFALIAPGSGDPAEQIGERRQAVARLVRKIGTAEERRAVGCQEHRQWPAAGPTVQHLVGQLVDVVEIGPLLAIDLDVHEIVVHQIGGGAVLEGLVGHDVAPVAGRVADRKEDRAVFATGGFERLVAPRPPVHRVVCVLLQVRRCFVVESIGHPNLRAATA